MSQPVIHLEEYYLEKILVERTRQATDEITITFDHDYKIKRNADNPHEFALTFIVRDNPALKTPHPQVYTLDLRITGFFRFNKGADEDQMQYLIRFNGCTILYGILRGMLATITGTFPEGAIRMPTIMIDEIVKKVEGLSDRPQTRKTAKKTIKKTIRTPPNKK